MPNSEERHLVVEFTCLPENAELVEKHLRRFIEPARKEDGCLYYDLYKSVDIPGRFHILDGWRDANAVESHGNSANVAAVVGDLLPLLTAPIAIQTNNRLV